MSYNVDKQTRRQVCEWFFMTTSDDIQNAQTRQREISFHKEIKLAKGIRLPRNVDFC